MSFKKIITSIKILRDIVVFCYRLKIVFNNIINNLYLSFKWLFISRETTNFTYDLTKLNKIYLAQTISHIVDKSFDEIYNYILEVENDNSLKKHIITETKKSDQRFKSNKTVYFGRRIGWYAIVRAIKPKVIVETGVDKGLGACILTAALIKNNSEGYKGYYYGTDINPKAGFLLKNKYKNFGEILYGDSIKSLKHLSKKIDLFINDSNHSEDYEYNEYKVILNKLSKNSIILGDNAHYNSKLFSFSKKYNRSFLFFSEDPKNHFKNGAGIGFSYIINK
jgi:predicted O-methyltransferase YrrM